MSPPKLEVSLSRLESLAYSNHSVQTASQNWSLLVTFLRWLHSLPIDARPPSSFLYNGCKHCISRRTAFVNGRCSCMYLPTVFKPFLNASHKVFCLSSGMAATKRFVPLPISMFLLGNQFFDFSQSTAFRAFPLYLQPLLPSGTCAGRCV